jgi:hypothetical protein
MSDLTVAQNQFLGELFKEFKSILSSLFLRFLATKSATELLELEKEVVLFGQDVVGNIFGYMLQELVDQESLRRLAFERLRVFHPSYCSRGRRKVTITMSSGWKYTIKTPYYGPPKEKKKGRKKKRGRAGSGCYPVLELLGIRGRITPATAEKIARMATICSSFQEAQEQLARTGFEIEWKAMRRHVWDFGQQALEAHLHRLEKWVSGLASGEEKLTGMRVVVSVDGGKLRTRTPNKRGARTKKGRKGFTTQWVEPRVVCIYLIDDKGKKVAEGEVCWYDASIDDADNIFERLASNLRMLGVQEAQEVIFVADGAEWIWNRTENLREKLGIPKEKYHEIIDLYHAIEHLTKVVKLRKRWGQINKEKWVKKAKKLLRKGEIEKLSEMGKELLVRKHWKALEYFTENEHRMRYDEFRSKNLPIGSGAVESAVRRIINLRMKGPGILWLKENAQKMLLMRAQLKAGLWDELVELTFENSFDLSVGSLTP